MFTISGPGEILTFFHVFRSVTFISDSLQAIRTGQIPQVPVLLGGVEDEGTIFAPLYPNVTFFLGATFGRLSVFRPPNVTEVNSFYPGLNDTQILDAVVRDVLFRWCVLRFVLRTTVLNRLQKIVQRNYGVKRSSQVGSRMYTGTPTVCPTKLSYLSPQANRHLRTIFSGAKFPNLQSVNDLGVWHGSECMSEMSCNPY